MPQSLWPRSASRAAAVPVPLREDLVLGGALPGGGCTGHAPAHPLVSPPACLPRSIAHHGLRLLLQLIACCCLHLPPACACLHWLATWTHYSNLCLFPLPCLPDPACLPAPPAAAPRTTCSTQGTMTTRHSMPWARRSASGRGPSLITSARQQRSRWGQFVLWQSVPCIPADAVLPSTRPVLMLRRRQQSGNPGPSVTPGH
jgi:hypothetical protein